MSRTIDVVLRFDDPSPTSDHALEQEILRVLEMHAACATFAVIPYAHGKALRPEQVGHLTEARREGVIEIALHGHSHVSHRAMGEVPSEFAGAASADQDKKIADGRAVLEQVFGVGIDGFVPSFNAYDQATIAALERQGFRYLSAGGGAFSPFHFINFTCSQNLSDVRTPACNS